MTAEQDRAMPDGNGHLGEECLGVVRVGGDRVGGDRTGEERGGTGEPDAVAAAADVSGPTRPILAVTPGSWGADPAAYVLTHVPSLARARAACEAEEPAADLLLGAQAALGVPEAQRRLWSPAESESLVEEWVLLEAEHRDPPDAPCSLSRARARIAFLRTHVMELPPRLRPAAVNTLEALGLGGPRRGMIRAIVEALERGNLVQVYSHAMQGQP